MNGWVGEWVGGLILDVPPMVGSATREKKAIWLTNMALATTWRGGRGWVGGWMNGWVGEWENREVDWLSGWVGRMIGRWVYGLKE